VAVAAALAAGAAGAADLVRVNAFPNAKSLPLHAGVAQGIFAARGLEVRLSFTENSTKQREGLAAGAFDVVHAAVDNAVAMADGGRADVVIVSGGDSGMNQFFVQSYVGSFEDLRGRVLVVDAPNTAYALLAKKMLLKHGLREGRDYSVKPVGRGGLRLEAMAQDRANAAAILNLPYTIQAEEMGMKSLGNPVEMLGPYQANGAFALRAWAESHRDVVQRYLAAYVESLRWVLDPRNRGECIAILERTLHVSTDVAARTWRQLADPAAGFTPDAKFDLQGFRNMLALRQEIEGAGHAAPAPEKYIDLSYYERALARVARSRN
jgi:ABC-type nitrate/sulfonate/bicarbonate transport system substrate-binding protein